MSSESLPITPAAFAEAIKELTLPVLYAKVAELRNSIAHLQRSDAELRTFIAESCETEADKRELEGYIAENEGVKESMDVRIALCKAEVEQRGQIWIELDEIIGNETKSEEEGRQVRSAESGFTSANQTGPAVNGTGNTGASSEGGRSTAEDDDDDGNDGVYL
ncbi:hypothetical protein BJY01DRAFT_240311 [Aspergillus pseudoustus]|uniref:Uncharacterized protein n=1 Tax=Aspergillus pseudoustus TaxID=1810923 RepID=A0ABR4ISY7_9EURO